ncbi:MFS-type transporter SLC18B1 isoform X5 [Pantherophis guttatus]|uniref:MFS-type transporter SLC18B1 isoform X5 n=1 Tax=Pantherophis guttatus TaxID=94885 RepID=A0A6P9C515_PANGU|nr:MFS-type transporter SLC18B1 isoform X5 [Pantherophis guttatus]
MESYQAVGPPDGESPGERGQSYGRHSWGQSGITSSPALSTSSITYNDRLQVANEEPKRLSREQMFIMVSTASLNFSSMVCYSILGPFFPREAEKKGVSSTIVGFIFGCFALFNFLTSLIMGKYGILEIFTGLGLVLGPPIGGFLYQSFGYEIPFIALGSVMLLMMPLNMFILPNYNSIPKKDSFLKLIVLPKVAILCLNIFGLSSSIAFLDPTMSLFVLEKFKLPAGYVGLVFLALALPYSLSSPLLGFLSDKKPRLRKWLLIIGAFLTTLCYIFLGPAPILHIESQLWLFILMLVLNGFALAMTAIPIYPEAINCAYENGFEEGLSLLGLVSGLFGALWALGSFVGPTLGGFLNEKLGFEWSAAIQGGFTLLSVPSWNSSWFRAREDSFIEWNLMGCFFLIASLNLTSFANLRA